MKNQLSSLEKELLTRIASTCERDPEIINSMHSESFLIGPESPLDLDSLDAIEIVSLIQSNYGIRITNPETSRDVLKTVGSLANYITAHQ